MTAAFAPGGPQVSPSIGTEAAKRGNGVALAAPESVSASGPGAIGRGDRLLPKLHKGGVPHAVPSREARRGGGVGGRAGPMARRRAIGRGLLGMRGAVARAGALPDLQGPRWGSVGRGLHGEVPAGRTTATSHGLPASPGDVGHGRRPRVGPGLPAQGGLQGGLSGAVNAPLLRRGVAECTQGPSGIKPGLTGPTSELGPVAGAVVPHHRHGGSGVGDASSPGAIESESPSSRPRPLGSAKKC